MTAAPLIAPLIVLDRLTKDYGRRRALDAVTLEVPRGRVGLLGPNGAGKSTLIKCLLGLVRPTAGRGEVLGFDIARRPLALRERVGYFPEVDCHVPDVSAAELVTLMGELAGLPRVDAIRRAHEVLDYVGLAEERYRPVGGYSAGMRQRVKLAQAIVHDPELLLLDEPTNALDPVSRERMLELIRDLGERRGMSIVYSSHLLSDVERVCDHVVILRGGSVIAQGALSDLRRGEGGAVDARVAGPPEALAAFRARLAAAGVEAQDGPGGALRLTGADLPRATVEAARDAGVQLRAFRPVRATLEDVFIEAVAAPAPGGGGA
ncbi:MAG: ABC transporter ATP-binding protein [Planctomycetes bacterium]|nr:ABC transporter ATP-binding protein [Planctomycetota bacterium]